MKNPRKGQFHLRKPATGVFLGSIMALLAGLYTMFMAGGGVKAGLTYGETDEYGRETVDGRVHIHDLHATMLHLLGLDHEALTFAHAGRDFRLTDVKGRVVREILA